MRSGLAVGLLFLACGCGDGDAGKEIGRDNTAVNERDADGDTPTPFDQSNEQSDIDLAAEIRGKVVDLEDLSTSGQNVKIITNEGKVLLRGPVASAAERDAIVQTAEGVAGAENVTNELEVETDE